MISSKPQVGDYNNILDKEINTMHIQQSNFECFELFNTSDKTLLIDEHVYVTVIRIPLIYNNHAQETAGFELDFGRSHVNSRIFA